MMDIIRENKEVCRREVEKSIGKDATGKEVLDYLFGGGIHEEGDAGFFIMEWLDDSKRTPLHRFNMFWAVPLTLLCAPYQYVRHGYVGWTTKTKFGRWIIRVTGHLKE